MEKFILVLKNAKGNECSNLQIIADCLADVMCCARGWLRASFAGVSVTVFDEEGNWLVSYKK